MREQQREGSSARAAARGSEEDVGKVAGRRATSGFANHRNDRNDIDVSRPKLDTCHGMDQIGSQSQHSFLLDAVRAMAIAPL